MKKITASKFLTWFVVIVVVLWIVKLLFPSVAGNGDKAPEVKNNKTTKEQLLSKPVSPMADAMFFDANHKSLKHRIFSVPGFEKSFPDQNDVQLLAAMANGVTPVENRADAQKRGNDLVYVGSNPYFYIDRLKNSIPFLVPKASVLLQDIGERFFDSLQVKGIPLHKIIVTSVMRSKDDVAQLQSKNRNAKVNSCHLYGTTFDVCYNRYKTVQSTDIRCRQVRNDTLKWVLAEVLRDFRAENRCLIKYEINQGCFHITVK